jgi:hypothetical protein
MKNNTPMEIKGYIFMPTIAMYVLMGICVIASIFGLVYEIYIWI